MRGLTPSTAALALPQRASLCWSGLPTLDPMPPLGTIDKAMPLLAWVSKYFRNHFVPGAQAAPNARHR
jgi:hypothetical protein